ncbi:hypothetical protein GGR57DRAFT_503423 [Xylariaceae sp. FL1272]|nr:hypothetical protein GGR57DRAFT_503423 [Xylariaceae sp. FL1272]
MAKRSRRSNNPLNSEESCKASSQARSLSQSTTVSALGSDLDIAHRLRVLLFDLKGVRKNLASKQRLTLTIDKVYISRPYFTEEEATLFKSAVVDHEIHHTDAEFDDDDGDDGGSLQTTVMEDAKPPRTVQEHIQTRMASFSKRRASGDARPGSHYLAPIYGIWRCVRD